MSGFLASVSAYELQEWVQLYEIEHSEQKQQESTQDLANRAEQARIGAKHG